MDIENVNFNQICRACLREKDQMKSLFTKDTNSIQPELRLDEMLMSSTRIQIKVDDGLPSQICLRCLEQLYSTHTFNNMCKESDARLKSYAAKVCLLENQSQNQFKAEYITQHEFIDIQDFSNTLHSELPVVKTENRQKKIRINDVLEENDSSVKYLVDFNLDDDADYFSDISGDEPPTMISESAEESKGYTRRIDIEPEMREFNKVPKKTTSGKNVTFPCTICHMKLRTENALKLHVASHTGQHAMLSCEFCDETFNTLRSLQRHKQKHTSVPKYKCTPCQLKFYRSDHLQRHLMRHSGKKPHQCDQCSRGFYIAKLLLQHREAVHREGLKTSSGIRPRKKPGSGPSSVSG